MFFAMSQTQPTKACHSQYEKSNLLPGLRQINNVGAHSFYNAI